MSRRIVYPSETQQSTAANMPAGNNPTARMPSTFSAGAPNQGTTAQGTPDSYSSKLIKYIPSEIVAAYITMEGIVKSSAQPDWLHWTIFIVLFILTPLYVWRVTSQPGKKSATFQIVVSTLSFLVWVFALGGPFALQDWYDTVYGVLILPLYTLIVPILDPNK